MRRDSLRIPSRPLPDCSSFQWFIPTAFCYCSVVLSIRPSLLKFPSGDIDLMFNHYCSAQSGTRYSLLTCRAPALNTHPSSFPRPPFLTVTRNANSSVLTTAIKWRGVRGDSVCDGVAGSKLLELEAMDAIYLLPQVRGASCPALVVIFQRGDRSTHRGYRQGSNTLKRHPGFV